MENGSSNAGPPMRGGFRGRGGNIMPKKVSKHQYSEFKKINSCVYRFHASFFQ